MIVEHRTYKLKPGKVTPYFECYPKTGLAIPLDYLLQPVSYTCTEIGPLNQIIHLWGYTDLNERQRCRNLLKQDPRCTEYLAMIMPLIEPQESRILTPAGFFSPIAVA